MDVDNLLTSIRDLNDHLNHLRSPWESSRHWEARRKFLYHNWNSFEDKDRLVSLSCAWSNVNFMGNRYSDKVMDKLKEMEKGLDYPKDLINYPDNKSKINHFDNGSSSLEHTKLDKLPTGFVPMNFVKSTESKSQNSSQISTRPVDGKSAQLDHNGTTDTTTAVSFNKTKVKQSNNNKVTIRSASCLSENNPSKSAITSNQETSSKLLKTLSQFSLKLSKCHSNLPPAEKISMLSNIAQQMSANVAYFYASVKKDDYSLYRNWADCCQSKVDMTSFAWVCDLYIDKVFISQGCGTSKSSAKASAVVEAIKILNGSYSVTNLKRRLQTSEYALQLGVEPQPRLYDSPPLATLQGVPLIKLVQDSIKEKNGPNSQTNLSCIKEKKKLHSAPVTPHKIPTNTKLSTPFSSLPNKKLASKSLGLDNFVVVLSNEQQNAVANLVNSTSMSKFSLEFVRRQSLPGNFEFIVLLNQVEIACGSSETVAQAKSVAAENALSFLKSRCPVLIKTKQVGNLDEALMLDNKATNSNELDFNMSENNVGNKLLRKMGWSGSGGLGKNEDGISEPVQAGCLLTQNFRTGLGHETSKQVKFENAERAIRDYVRQGCVNELTFSPELSNHERRVIHTLARKHGLKSKSFGTTNRHLVIFKPLSVQDIVRNLSRTGGELNGYELAEDV